ncbi:MAG: hypothetical protein E6F99_21390 [Actinobacteria bacterium]|nr:MAG: hypothetical protein E6F99_21390 [Actinomycetota bacterium]
MNRKRVQVTYTRSRKGLVACQSAAIHSLSLKVLGDVVGLMNVGWLQDSAPEAAKVPRLTVTVLGAVLRLKPRPA